MATCNRGEQRIGATVLKDERANGTLSYKKRTKAMDGQRKRKKSRLINAVKTPISESSWRP